ncbi:hypothetical protein DFJ73DRAFT_346408 [Zopfochytrium polystomum]|nr:hypothetical protein DFJ73DRAFT_346408 [Zopfochytrium polystomum]
MVDSIEIPFKIMCCIGGVLCLSWLAYQSLTHRFLLDVFFLASVLCATLANGVALSKHSELEPPAVAEKGLYCTEQSVKTLLAALKVNKSVKSLDLANHRMCYGHELLKRGLQDCPFLSSLNLRGNGFTTKEQSGFLSRLSVTFG